MKQLRKKILIVFQELQVNGATKSLLALMRAICDDYDISLFLFCHDGVYMDEIPSQVTLLPENFAYRAFHKSLRYAIPECLRAWRLDLLLFRMWVSLLRVLRIPFLLWNCLPKVLGEWDLACGYSDDFVSEMIISKVAASKKILWAHENYVIRPRTSTVLAALSKADAVVTVSQDAATRMRSVLGLSMLERVFVVHNITEVDSIRKMAEACHVRLSDHSRNLVSVGRISPEKGYDRIPCILKALIELGVDVNWTVIGPGSSSYRDSILADANNIGIAERICFLGGILNPYPYISSADCFVQLSRNEGWGMTVSEAIVLGVPVVANDISVFHEQIIHGTNGYLANMNDPVAFADSILRAFSLKPIPKVGDDFPFSPINAKHEFDMVVTSVENPHK